MTSSVPETMRAAYVETLGSADIRYGQLPVPSIGPTDVLVAVDAVTVNPVDTFVRSGGYATATPFPSVIGRDLTGRDRLPTTLPYRPIGCITPTDSTCAGIHPATTTSIVRSG